MLLLSYYANETSFYSIKDIFIILKSKSVNYLIITIWKIIKFQALGWHIVVHVITSNIYVD